MREAHAIDSRSPLSRVMVEDPISDTERQKVCNQCIEDLKLPMTAVVDGIDDKVGAAYSAWPDRLYLVGKDGKIAYAGGRGPFGFKTGDLEDAIIEELARVRAGRKEAKR